MKSNGVFLDLFASARIFWIFLPVHEFFGSLFDWHEFLDLFASARIFSDLSVRTRIFFRSFCLVRFFTDGFTVRMAVELLSE